MDGGGGQHFGISAVDTQLFSPPALDQNPTASAATRMRERAGRFRSQQRFEEEIRGFAASRVKFRRPLSQTRHH